MAENSVQKYKQNFGNNFLYLRLWVKIESELEIV